MARRKKTEEFVHCTECGLDYNSLYNYFEHKRYHKRYLEASLRFGPTIFFPERERLKGEAYLTLSIDGGSISEKVTAVEKLFLAYFNRSLENSGFDLRTRHPSFSDYCAMLLNQKHWDNRLKPYSKVHRVLLRKYGRKEGIYTEGTTSYPTRRQGPSYKKPFKEA